MTTSSSSFNIEAAARLVTEMSENLEALPKDNERYAELRAEVNQLKAMLEEAQSPSGAVEDKMRSVHTLVDGATLELQADGMRAGILLREMGRILGLN